MKTRVIAAISTIVGDKLTPEEIDNIATEVIAVTENFNKSMAIAALESAKATVAKSIK
jgi:hypothetical protein